jgi:YegS/Rv2252/BmrU family lipid kinase
MPAENQLFEPACDRANVAIVFNPVSGTEDPATRRSTLEELARGAGLTCGLVETDRERGAGPLAERAVADGVERLIVAGGDGSATEAAHVLVGTATALAVLPAGTGNLLALNLGIPLDHEEALRLALTGDAKPIDVGRANGAAFIIAVGLGLDARIIRDANREMKRRWGKLAYFITGWRNLRRPNDPYTIIVDGRRARRTAQTVMIANLGRITGGLELVPDTDPTDGLLEVAILRSRHVPDLARLAWRMVVGGSHPADVLEVQHAQHVVVETTVPQPLQLDGNEAGRTTRLEVTVEPGGLLLVRPDPPEPMPVVAVVAATSRRPRAIAVAGVGAIALLAWLTQRRRRVPQ